MELPSPMYLGAGGTDHSQIGYDPHLNGGLSLQEMIDSDIKADFDDVLQSNPLSFQGMDSLDMLNDLDTITFLDGPTPTSSLWASTPATTTATPVSTPSLHPSSYGSFSNSYLEDMSASASVMVNPNNVMPIHPLQHQQVTSLSVNTSLNPHSPGSQNSPQSPMPSPMFGNQQMASQQHYQQTQQRPAKSVRVLPPVSSPMQQVPSSASSTGTSNNSTSRKRNHTKSQTNNSNAEGKENGYPKPAYSYSCLIALALKNSHTGSMSVSEIYKFMCEHFPYFKNAPSGWKNSVRHNLSLNKCFEKIEKPASNGSQRKGCLWAMNPNKIQKMNEEVQKWSRKDPMAIKKGMACPESLPALEKGEMKKDYNANTTGVDSEDEEDPRTPTSVSSQGSQGYDSAGSDFVDIEGFSQITPLPDSSLPEISLQSRGVYDDLGDDRLTFGATSTVNDVVVSGVAPVTTQLVTTGAESFYPATIRGQYSIAPATTIVNGHQKTYHTIVNVAPAQPKNL
jgi:hypothetical protein